MPSPDPQGLYHPASEDEIISLVRLAIQNKSQIRVRGAAQSVAAAVYTDNFNPANPGTAIDIELDQMRTVQYDEAAMQAIVGAGCNLGFDPFDPSETSSYDNSLVNLLQTKGWAIQNVSDAIHQTIAGFISTGSSGGSMTHSFDQSIVAIRIVDGNGVANTFSPTGNGSDTFYALGSSLGLLGIIVSVTIQCVPSYNVIGTETVTPVASTPYYFLGTEPGSQTTLQSFITETEFTRLLWWPYKTLQRMITWQARTMQPGDYNNQTGPPTDFKPRPYEPIFPKIMGSSTPAEAVASTGYYLIGNWPNWLYDMLGNSDQVVVDFVEKAFPYLYPLLIDMYFPCNSAAKPPQQFWDQWLGSLPMDTDEFSNDLFKLGYTEMWFDAGDIQQVVNLMQQLYHDKGYAATNCYCVEILGSKASPFWLSPAYNRDSIRINIMWWTTNDTSPMGYFQQFWDLLQPLNYRLHWGKVLPPPASKETPAWLASQYPMWSNFMALRKQMDPNNIFLTTYWKQQLAID